MSKRYCGVIKTKAAAMDLIKGLEANGSARALAAAGFIKACPERFLARPALQPEVIAMANTTGLDANRPGGVINRILNSK